MKYLTYVVEIKIAENWIVDGADFQEHYVERIRNLLPYATENEIKVKVIQRPTKREIKRLQK